MRLLSYLLVTAFFLAFTGCQEQANTNSTNTAAAKHEKKTPGKTQNPQPAELNPGEDAAGQIPGLYAVDGRLMRKGKPYTGMGVNYFNAFFRVLKDVEDKSYKEGFRTLRQDYNVPFIRFMAGGYWPVEWKLYLQDKQRYFELMDELVAEAEKQELGLVPCLFWYVCNVPDIAGESMDQIGNPKSKTMDFFRTYTREIVGRYADSEAIWAWEFGNEHLLAADIPRNDEDPNFGRAPIVPEMGTALTRTERDRPTRAAIRTAYRIFAEEVRKIDPHRLISTGDAAPNENAFHRSYFNNWQKDSKQQWMRLLANDNPGMVDSVSVHIYPHHDNLYFADEISIEEFIGVCKDVAEKENKVFFVGEFGAPKTLENEREIFYKIYNAIIDHNVPLSAVWVYDYPPQNNDWNITEDNEREYMLREVKNFNDANQPNP